MSGNNITKLPAKSEALTHDPRKKALLEKRDEFIRAIKFDGDLTAGARLVGIYIAEHINADPTDTRFGCAWPSITSISEDMGLGRRTVQRALKELGEWFTMNDECPWKPDGGYSFDPIWEKADAVLLDLGKRRAARKTDKGREQAREQAHKAFIENGGAKMAPRGCQNGLGGRAKMPPGGGQNDTQSLLLTTCTDHLELSPKVAPKGRDVIVRIDEVARKLSKPMDIQGRKKAAEVDACPRRSADAWADYDPNAPF